eukprot:7381710-Prymnesium_polylepis.3
MPECTRIGTFSVYGAALSRRPKADRLSEIPKDDVDGNDLSTAAVSVTAPSTGNWSHGLRSRMIEALSTLQLAARSRSDPRRSIVTLRAWVIVAGFSSATTTLFKITA